MTGWDRNPRLKQRIPVPAPPEHEHSAADITSGVFGEARIPTLDLATKTSGTLPIARGGTGATTAADARAALAATYAGHIGDLSDLDDWDQYPLGYSVGYFSNTAAGRPSNYGTVITNKALASRTFQIAHAHIGDAVYTRYYYSGSWGAWQRLAQEGQNGIPFAMAAGAVAISFSNQAVSSASVTFPAGRFTVTPVVTLTQASLQGGSGLLIPKVTGTSSSGFTAYAYMANAGNTTVSNVQFYWTAVQMTSASGVG